MTRLPHGSPELILPRRSRLKGIIALASEELGGRSRVFGREELHDGMKVSGHCAHRQCRKSFFSPRGSASPAPRRPEGGRPRPSRGVFAAGTSALPRSWRTTQGAQVIPRPAGLFRPESSPYALDR